MSTNYYLVERVEVLESTDYNNVERSVVLETKYHMCKLSSGWKPLFDCSHGAFETWEQLHTLAHGDGYNVYDEYDTLMDWTEFEAEVRCFNLNSAKVNKELAIYKDTAGYDWCTTCFT